MYGVFVRSAMIYGGETWVLRKQEEGVLRRAERAMVRMMCGTRLKNRQNSGELMLRMGLHEDIVTLVRRARMRWYGHVMRRDENVGIRRALELEVAGGMRRGRPKIGWKEQVEKDIQNVGLRREQVGNTVGWRKGVHGFILHD